MKQVLELVGHVLPSALGELALAMAAACIAFSPPGSTTNGDEDGSLRDSRQAANGDTRQENDDDRVFRGLGNGFAQGDGTPTIETTAAAPVDQPKMKHIRDPIASASRAVEERDAEPTAGSASAQVEQALFRAVSSVDQDTVHFNAAFRSLEASAGGGEGGSTSRALETSANGGETGSGALEPSAGAGGEGGGGETTPLSAGHETTGSSYCLEARARVLVVPEMRPRREGERGRRRRVVFDVCSTDPTTGMSHL